MNETPSSQQPPSEDSGDAAPPGGTKATRRRRLGAAATILLLTAILAAIFAVWLLPGDEGPDGAPPIPAPGEERGLENVSDRPYDADFLWELTLDSASMPADIALLDGRIFVLDTNNSRILEVDEENEALEVLKLDGDDLLTPMAMIAYAGRLYVANSGAGNIVVIDPEEGAVEEIITPDAPAGEYPLRPIGIAIARGGDIFLSDPDNHRVLHLDKDGGLVSTLGSGIRDSGAYGLNTPGGLSLDAQGNLYVVDMLNYSVKKYSPSGEFLLSVGEAGDTEGAFSRPKTVAVDEGGHIFVSDTLLVAVQVFDADGLYAGFIGRRVPEDKESESMFQAPHGLKIVENTLYVMDRFSGLFALRLPG